jgi:hypothetical protein
MQPQPPYKKARFVVVDNKRKQQEEPEEEERSPQKKIMYVPPPTRLEPLRMATRRANIVQLLTDRGYMGRRPTPLELQETYDRYIQLYPTDYDITPYDFMNIASITIGGKIRRHKKHVYSYKKRSINKKRAKSMKKKRS